MITRSQGEALVALLGQLRKDWDLPGIRAAVQKSGDLGNAVDISVAACRLAANPDARTPGLLPMPGTHWTGTTVAGKPVVKNCPEHGEPLGRCTGCDAASQGVDHEAHAQQVRDVLRAAREAARRIPWTCQDCGWHTDDSYTYTHECPAADVAAIHASRDRADAQEEVR